jgi:hypothetical protein
MLTVALAGFAGPETGEVETGEVEPGEVEPAPAVCDLALRAPEIDAQQFIDAAALRMPELRVRPFSSEPDPRCRDRLHAHVELRALEQAKHWEWSLILSDGRAWYRSFEAEPEQVGRVLASALANLFAGLEDDPDATGVTFPGSEEDEGSSGESEEPAPEEAEADAEAPPEVGPGPVRFELGPRLSGLTDLGLYPGPGLRAFGGAAGLDLRLPDGLAFGFGLRALTLRRGDHTVVRTRVLFGLGVAARWEQKNFELPFMVFASVEPWVVRSGGRQLEVGAPPLIGGGARVVPSLLFELGDLHLRVGVSADLQLSVEAAPGALTAAVALSPDAPPIHRLGGAELGVGLELGLWIPVRERRP